MIEGRPLRKDDSISGAERRSDAERQTREEAKLRHHSPDFSARDISRVSVLRTLARPAADGRESAHAWDFRLQAEIGEPMREIEVTPLEEPVPDFVPAEEPAEAPVQPVREPERVPA